MAIKILYQTKEKSRTSRETRYKETLEGTESEVNTYINSLVIGTTTKEGLYLQTWRKSQYGGNLFQVECQYSQLDNWFSYSSLPSTEVGKKSATLSVRNLQLPLENLSDYLQNWNHYLIQLASTSTAISTPQWWSTLGYDDEIPSSDIDHYRWISTLSEKPSEADQNGDRWYVVEKPTKPGVQYYDYAYFVVTELARYRTAQDAGTALNKGINTIISPSNTFGITGGNWKLDEASVQYDGNAWISSGTYTHSPTGWDTDLYSSSN